jgi:hypothetical protein
VLKCEPVVNPRQTELLMYTLVSVVLVWVTKESPLCLSDHLGQDSRVDPRSKSSSEIRWSLIELRNASRTLSAVSWPIRSQPRSIPHQYAFLTLMSLAAATCVRLPRMAFKTSFGGYGGFFFRARDFLRIQARFNTTRGGGQHGCEGGPKSLCGANGYDPCW